MNSSAEESSPEAGTQALVLYNEMCRAIAEALEVDEVKNIRDKAMAFALYAKQANNHEAELQAIQIRVRAERKVGELSKNIEKTPGARTDLSAQSGEVTKSAALEKAGISTHQASEWERLADVPEEEFEKALITSDAPSARRIVQDRMAAALALANVTSSAVATFRALSAAQEDRERSRFSRLGQTGDECLAANPDMQTAITDFVHRVTLDSSLERALAEIYLKGRSGV
jgi:hypothetical protein